MFIKPVLRRIKRRIFFLLVRIRFWIEVRYSGAESFNFVCNICGSNCRVPLSCLSRESMSCYGCGSTIRYRSVIYSLLEGLKLDLTPLPFLSASKNMAGVGMTDSDVYAKRLQRKFSYRNTYYHKEPRLDILSIDETDESRADFIICSDVLEHVCPPVSLAFKNLFRLLKPGGVLIVTVPIVEDVYAKEHFPNLCEYHFELRQDRRVLINKTAAGCHEEFNDIVFHGGEGETLEMRIFSREWLLEELTKAGFAKIKVMEDECAEFGILWGRELSVPVLAWK